MLFKGWRRLFQDCIGREGPFLETMCVPFAGLAILLWPLAVGGALLASMLSSVFIGAYAAVIVYKVTLTFILISKSKTTERVISICLGTFTDLNKKLNSLIAC